ncbi:aminoacyl-tRNA deacylase [Aeromicrobium sp. PE09-221]|uniref:Cys-tRNA(Pro) deacylase n=1 Tax=Aeromicrobium sp. PE09-221 TaxID=1898043 RepID=UPI000B3E59D6|nr:Cys-tRNA(Pro) deacylase [Aeromicrobium sp. PE09-221]OUZ09923.1 aminoacyl-tRNA deacylase [Aeromicrobium sp. PE09-221]
MAKRTSTESTPAFTALRRAGVRATAHSYEHDPRAESFGLEGAEALGLDPARVFKTLVIDIGGRLAVAVVPVSARLDLKASAAALGTKRATMADPEAAQRATGYVVGGISPFGQRTRLRTVVDTSVRAWPTVFVSGGRRGLEAEVSPDDLIGITDAIVAAIAR